MQNKEAFRRGIEKFADEIGMEGEGKEAFADLVESEADALALRLSVGMREDEQVKKAAVEESDTELERILVKWAEEDPEQLAKEADAGELLESLKETAGSPIGRGIGGALGGGALGALLGGNAGYALAGAVPGAALGLSPEIMERLQEEGTDLLDKIMGAVPNQNAFTRMIDGLTEGEAKQLWARLRDKLGY